MNKIKEIMSGAWTFAKKGVNAVVEFVQPVVRPIVVAVTVTVATVSAFATDAVAPDPTATISSLTQIWYSVGAVAITILLWKVGRRLVVRFFN